MSRIIALANQKGGVAKTTTTMNLGAALAERGKNVLLLDVDPQANLTVGLGLDPSQLEYSMSTILAEDKASLTNAIYETNSDSLQIVPAEIGLASVEFNMVNRVSRETILQQAIDNQIREHYDYILLDSPPNLGMLTFNVLSAAKEVIIPVATHFYGLQGIAALLERIDIIKSKINPELSILGILATRYDPRTSLAKGILDELAAFKLPIFKTVIHEAVRLAESPAEGKSIIDYEPQSLSAKQYRDLATEVDDG